jgi:hypothetical protein
MNTENDYGQFYIIDGPQQCIKQLVWCDESTPSTPSTIILNHKSKILNISFGILYLLDCVCKLFRI